MPLKDALLPEYDHEMGTTRRLLERGVRFVQVFNGAYAMGEGVGNWDGHKSLKSQYDVHAPILSGMAPGTADRDGAVGFNSLTRERRWS